MLGLGRSALLPPKASLSSNYDLNSNFPTSTDSLQTKPPQATLYQILRIPCGASQTEIKSAYRTLAKQFHPDAASSDPSAAHFMVIHDAYATLSDPVARANYDSSIAAASAVYHFKYSASSNNIRPRRTWETDQCW